MLVQMPLCRAPFPRNTSWALCAAVLMSVGCTEARGPGADTASTSGGTATAPAPETDAATPGATTPDADGGTDAAKPSPSSDAALTVDQTDAAARPEDASPGPDIDAATGDADLGPDASQPAGPRFALPPATTPRLETLVSPSELPSTENGAFTEDGRFFVIGGASVYEIVEGPEGYRAEMLAEVENGQFGGITSRGQRLYAAMANSATLAGELLVYEPTRADPLVGRAPIQSGSNPLFNGMAFGPDGALYLSNSQGTNDANPAVVRLEITQEEPLRFVQTPFVAAFSTARAENSGGGAFPNGIRFAGDFMYLVRGADVVAVPVDLTDPTAEFEVLYKAQGTLAFIDDFDIADDRMWLTQFDALRVLGVPGQSNLVVTSLGGNVEYELDLPFVGSSTIVSHGSLFGPSILLTSYFNGGLYRLTFD